MLLEQQVNDLAKKLLELKKSLAQLETKEYTQGGAASYTTENAQDDVGGILVDSATIDFTYNDATPSITAIVIDDSITDDKLRESAALSVIGRSANSTGNPADIAAGSDGEVLRRSGTTLAFGTVATAGITDDAVTYAKIQNVSATDRLLGRVSASAGNIEEIEITDFVQTILNDPDAATVRSTLGLGTMALETATDYLLLAGRAGGQTGNGGTASGESLTLHGSAHATKGPVLINPTNGGALIGLSAALTGGFGAGLLEISKTSNGTFLLHRESADTGGPTLEFLKRRSAWGVVSDGDRIGSIGWSAADGTDAANGLQLYGEVDGSPGADDMPMRLVIAVSPDGSATVAEALRVNSSGNLVMADGKRIESDEVRARDSGGLKLFDDAGNGMTLADGGLVTFSNGLSFGNETLSTYDEGTWTPAITGSGSNPTVTYTTQSGKYTQTGNVVFFYLIVTINTISGGSGDIRISLPSTAVNTPGIQPQGMVRVSGVDLTGTPAGITFSISAGASFGRIRTLADNAADTIEQISALAAGDTITVTGFYFTS